MSDQKRTVLVVDDESEIVRSVQDLLRLDYRVLASTSPEDGLRLLDEEDVHVVMSDQRMPTMSGVEFLTRCRTRHPRVVRLLFTGYADLDAVIAAINDGHVYRYLQKPWQPAELVTVLKEALDRWELEEERRRLLAELEAKNEALLAERELRAAFIKVASHELRAPLTILLGAVDLAGRAAGRGDDPWLARVRRAGERLRGLVDQLVSTLMAGGFTAELDRAPVDVADLLAEAAEDVRAFAETRGQTLTVHASEDAKRASLDHGKVRDLLDHLLLNAIKFTPDGGHIEVAARRDAEGAVLIEVRDDGDGIDEDHAARIFEPFFTGFDVCRHTSGRFEYGARGLGLGLTVVKEIAELHGGGVAVASRPGRGTTVSARLADPAAAGGGEGS